jgi:hypothetical protein
MPRLNCEDPNRWERHFTNPKNPVELIICPDCAALILPVKQHYEAHIQFHQGLNIFDPNFQEYKVNYNLKFNPDGSSYLEHIDETLNKKAP